MLHASCLCEMGRWRLCCWSTNLLLWLDLPVIVSHHWRFLALLSRVPSERYHTGNKESIYQSDPSCCNNMSTYPPQPFWNWILECKNHSVWSQLSMAHWLLLGWKFYGGPYLPVIKWRSLTNGAINMTQTSLAKISELSASVVINFAVWLFNVSF